MEHRHLKGEVIYIKIKVITFIINFGNSINTRNIKITMNFTKLIELNFCPPDLSNPFLNVPLSS